MRRRPRLPPVLEAAADRSLLGSAELDSAELSAAELSAAGCDHVRVILPDGDQVTAGRSRVPADVSGARAPGRANHGPDGGDHLPPDSPPPCTVPPATDTDAGGSAHH